VRLHLRLDAVTPAHIRQTVFVDGANCGMLTLDHRQYQILAAALLVGAEVMPERWASLRLDVEIDPISHDAQGNFVMPTVAP
jgi:hypothetical protein